MMTDVDDYRAGYGCNYADAAARWPRNPGLEPGSGLTFEVLPGDGGLGTSHRQAEEVHVVALVDRFVLRDVHYPGWHCE